MKPVSQAMRLLVNGARGIYVPQAFVTDYDLDVWSGISKEDAEILAAGPDGDQNFWEVWDDVLGSASFIEDGHTWTLYQDSDLWAICSELMGNEEYEKFFGEMKPCPDNAYEYEVCGTCLQVLANGDAGGSASDHEEYLAKEGLAALQHEYTHVSPDGAEYGFRWKRCECCGALPGNRYRVICMDRKAVAA